MHLVEILLPLKDRRGKPFSSALYDEVAQQLSERFGGVTGFFRSPAEGRWQSGGSTEHDEIIVLEVMADELDRKWWSALRSDLMKRFKQDDVVIRSHQVERII